MVTLKTIRSLSPQATFHTLILSGVLFFFMSNPHWIICCQNSYKFQYNSIVTDHICSSYQICSLCKQITRLQTNICTAALMKNKSGNI